MENVQKVRNWVEAGKQVGRSFSFTRNNVMFRSSVAVQKWNNGYKVYVNEIEEEYIQGGNYLREESIYRLTLSEIEEFINSTTLLSIADLAPHKGQKLFDPEVD